MASDGKTEVRKWTSIALCMNVFLFIAKLITGFFVMSIAIVSEAIDSGIDMAASTIARASAKKASEPPDEEHTYGHGKFENMGALTEAGLILITASLIIFGAYYRMTHIIELPLLDIGIIVLIISILLKVVVSGKLKALGKKHDSLVAKAEALNLGTDVYMTSTVLIMLVIIRAGTILDIQNIEILDPVAAIMVACFIIWAAVRIAKECTRGLVDQKLPEDELRKITDTLDRNKEKFVEYHRLRTRISGATRYIDLHLVMSKKLTVEESHESVTLLEGELTALFKDTNVLIHVDPCDGKCEFCEKEPT